MFLSAAEQEKKINTCIAIDSMHVSMHLLLEAMRLAPFQMNVSHFIQHQSVSFSNSGASFSLSPLLAPPTLPHFLLSMLPAHCEPILYLPSHVLPPLCCYCETLIFLRLPLYDWWEAGVVFSVRLLPSPPLVWLPEQNGKGVKRFACWWAVRVNTTLYLKIPLGLCSSKKYSSAWK